MFNTCTKQIIIIIIIIIITITIIIIITATIIIIIIIIIIVIKENPQIHIERKSERLSIKYRLNAF